MVAHLDDHRKGFLKGLKGFLDYFINEETDSGDVPKLLTLTGARKLFKN